MTELPCGKKRKNSSAVVNFPECANSFLSSSAGLFVASATAQTTVSFPTDDGGLVYADVYGEGDRAVVLAHGGQFNKESWKKQAEALVAAKFRVLALDFRGYGKSRGPGDSDPMDAPLYQDVLAAVRYLRKNGAKTVSVVGASMGGWAAGDASIASQPGEIDRLVFLGSAPTGPARQAQIPILCSSSHATMPAKMGRGSPESANNTKKLPNQQSSSSSMARPTPSFSSKPIKRTA